MFLLKFIFYFFLFFFGPLFVFHLITREYVNPFKLFMIFGKKGSGKSTYLVKLAYKYLKRGWHVYTNIADMALPGIRIIDPQLLGDFVPVANSLLLIDEAGTLYDNRNFKTFKESTRDFYKYQRHYKCIVYLASQDFDVDKKLRVLTDGLYLQVNWLRVFTVGKRIVRTVTLVDATAEADGRIADSLKFAPFWNWSYTFIPKYAKFFDSHVIPPKPYLGYKELCPDGSFNVVKPVSSTEAISDDLSYFDSHIVPVNPLIPYSEVGNDHQQIDILDLLINNHGDDENN